MRIPREDLPESLYDLLQLYVGVGIGTAIGICVYASYLA